MTHARRRRRPFRGPFSSRLPSRPGAALAAIPALVLAAGLSAATTTKAAGASEGDWPHWRGPLRDGTSPAVGLPTEWAEGRNVRWKLALPGVSGATPIVAGDLVFVHVGDGPRLELWAVGAADGAVRWKRFLAAGNEVTRKQNMSSPSPVTDGERVWVVTGTGVVKAFDRAGGELWRRDLQADYGRFGLNWGYASSPLLVDDALYVEVLHGMHTDEPSYVLALDAASGATRWRVERPTDARIESPDAYTTPALLTAHGRRELVVSGGDYVTGHDLRTGRELWRLPGLNPGREANYRVVASPVAMGERIYVPSRVSPLLALAVPAKGPPRVAWTAERGPDVPTPVSDGERLYVVNDRGILRRFDAATGGEIGEPLRLATGIYSASPVLAEGRLYAVNEQGVTTVVKVGAGEPEVVAENALSGFTLASPAIAGGRIYLRTSDYLYCIGAPGGAGGVAATAPGGGGS